MKHEVRARTTRDQLTGLADDGRARVLEALGPEDREQALADWRLFAHDAQLPPDGDWATWLLLGGRGSGKTRAGAEWVAAQARTTGRIALVGPSLHDVREVMIDGPSGLRSLPGRTPPRWEASRRRLVWSDGAVAQAFSAEDPESLRGPQFGAAWADEFCRGGRRGRRWRCCGWGCGSERDPGWW